MRTLAKLQQTKTFWILLALCSAFFLFRLPSLIEPYWYGDEGIYAVLGQAMNQGYVLYRDIWDNKPPLLYGIYALGNGDLLTAKMLSLISGLLSVIAFFLLSQKLFNKVVAISTITTAVYVVLFGTPLIEGNIANAENFMLLPIIIAALLIYPLSNLKRKTFPKNMQLSFLLAGLLIGIAFLFKIVAVFDFAAFFLFLLFINLPKKLSISLVKRAVTKLHYGRPLILFAAGLLTPLLLTMLYFLSQDALFVFLQSTFSGNVDYVGFKNELLGIPQGLLILKAVLLIVSVISIFFARNSLAKPVLFIVIWTTFSLFNTSFSGRPYTHYVLTLLPSFCLLIGLLLSSKTAKMRYSIFASIAVIVSVIVIQFPFSLDKAVLYYPNALQFVAGQKTVDEYQAFFDIKTLRNPLIASFITQHTQKTDKIFIWGNSPQIYALAQRLPATNYFVDYHSLQSEATLKKTQRDLAKAKPKYIITLDDATPLPFALSGYIMRFSIPSFTRVNQSVPGATIYERSF